MPKKYKPRPPVCGGCGREIDEAALRQALDAKAEYIHSCGKRLLKGATK